MISFFLSCLIFLSCMTNIISYVSHCCDVKKYSSPFWHWKMTDYELCPLQDWVHWILPAKNCFFMSQRLFQVECLYLYCKCHILCHYCDVKQLFKYFLTLDTDWIMSILHQDRVPQIWLPKQLLFHVITIVPGQIFVLEWQISSLMSPLWCKKLFKWFLTLENGWVMPSSIPFHGWIPKNLSQSLALDVKIFVPAWVFLIVSQILSSVVSSMWWEKMYQVLSDIVKWLRLISGFGLHTLPCLLFIFSILKHYLLLYKLSTIQN